MNWKIECSRKVKVERELKKQGTKVESWCAFYPLIIFYYKNILLGLYKNMIYIYIIYLFITILLIFLNSVMVSLATAWILFRDCESVTTALWHSATSPNSTVPRQKKPITLVAHSCLVFCLSVCLSRLRAVSHGQKVLGFAFYFNRDRLHSAGASKPIL